MVVKEVEQLRLGSGVQMRKVGAEIERMQTENSNQLAETQSKYKVGCAYNCQAKGSMTSTKFCL